MAHRNESAGENKMSIHLQSVGNVETKAAIDIKSGDTIMFNFGITSKVSSVEECSEKFLLVTFESGASAKYKKTKEICVL